MTETNDRSAVKITVTYDDGSVEDIDKGLAFHFEDNEDDPGVAHITAELVNLTGRDLYTVVGAVVEMGAKLGMFGGEDT